MSKHQITCRLPARASPSRSDLPAANRVRRAAALKARRIPMEQLINFVVRPPRAEYDPYNDLLRPRFSLKGRLYQRVDLELTNNHGHTLQCSHYMPLPTSKEKALPCVIYCHGNSGCRADASEAAVILLPSNITVFTLDFSGSGLSEGEYVTLGWNEMEDLKVVVAHLRTDSSVSCIGLWGRSMGAVTSLMYGAQDPSIAGMVLDSPFSNLVDLMMEMVDLYKFKFPKFTVKVAIQYMRKLILKKARFDIMELDAIKFARKTFIPALFGHATEDSFIQPHHSDDVYEAYMGDKNIIKFSGDHNSQRSQFYYDSINIFFHNVLQPPEVPEMQIDAYDDGFGESIDEVLESQHLLKEHNRIDAEEWMLQHFIEDAPCSNAGFESCFAQFPSCAEDEERMLVAAIAASIEDTDVSQTAKTLSIEGAPATSSSTKDNDLTLQTSTIRDNRPGIVQAQTEGVQSAAPPETQTIGMLEALGQKWGIGLFCATSNNSKQAHPS